MQSVNLDIYYRKIMDRLDRKSPYLVLHASCDGSEVCIKTDSITNVETDDNGVSSIVSYGGTYTQVSESPEDIKLMLKVAGHMFIRKDTDNGTIRYEEE